MSTLQRRRRDPSRRARRAVARRDQVEIPRGYPNPLGLVGRASKRIAMGVWDTVEDPVNEIKRGCPKFLGSAFTALIIMIIIFMVYDVKSNVEHTQRKVMVETSRAAEDFIGRIGRETARLGFDVASEVAKGPHVAMCAGFDVFANPNAKRNLAARVKQLAWEPPVAVLDERLLELSLKMKNAKIVKKLESLREQMRTLTDSRAQGPPDPMGRYPQVLMLDQKPHTEITTRNEQAIRARKVKSGLKSLTQAFTSSISAWIREKRASVSTRVKESLNPCKSYNEGLELLQRQTKRQVIAAVNELEMRLLNMDGMRRNLGEDFKILGVRILVLYAALHTLALLRKMILPQHKEGFQPLDDVLGDDALKDGPEISLMNFRMRKSRKASRKRRSAKKKSRKRKSAKRKASRKRRSVKRKVSRKRKSAKRKASRKRRSVKRKVSRKRKSAKRKASRKRKSAKRKASRKRRSVKRKVSRKRKSAKRKASRKRKSAKRKASRKRKSAKRKASRKKKSAKRKASRKRKRCPPGCVKRR